MGKMYLGTSLIYSSGDYVRPTDWIDISTITDGNINLLVNDTTLATYAFVCTTSAGGTYHVDWGDGTSGDFASGATAQHTYTVGAGQACNRGYTTFKIVISPSASNNLTQFYITSHSLATQNQEHGYLWCVWAARYVTSMNYAFSRNVATPQVFCKQLEIFKYVGTHAQANLTATNALVLCTRLQSVDIKGMVTLTDATNMFQQCFLLKSIDISTLTSLTTANAMFYTCVLLQTITFGNMTALLDTTQMFCGCNSLQDIDISKLTAITIANQMFASCYGLKTITVGTKPSLSNATYMFSGCRNLLAIDISGLTGITDATQMFNSCYLLQSVTFGSLSSLITTSQMFQNCFSLKSININTMTAVTTATGMFQFCYGLQSVTSTNFSSAAASLSAVNMFMYCEQLININLSNAKLTTFGAYGSSGYLDKLQTFVCSSLSTFSGSSYHINLTYCTLTAAQLNTIFTSLPTVTSKTIAITGCTGAASCTRTIATAKGWTVTG